MFTTYFHLLEKGEGKESAVRFAIEERHEANGHEKLACLLLAKAITHGIGFNETLELLLRLEDRVAIYKSSPIQGGCYDCNDDPELYENIDLLKKALLETPSPLRSSRSSPRFRQ